MADIQPDNSLTLSGNAENPETTAGDICAVCKTPIVRSYFRANSSLVCGKCADRLRREQPQDSHGAFVRAMLFGLVGFAIGLTVYSTFMIITGISIGYLSLAVGWIIGKAMMAGSKGIGGRRYQITALLLTYSAVSMAIIPVALSMIIKKRSEQPRAIIRQAPADPAAGQPGATPATTQTQPDQAGEGQGKKPPMGFFNALGMLALLGLASPFLELKEGIGGVIGLVILLVGMQFAWKMTAGPPRVTVEGPYELST
jgi:hypothetical protein